MAGQLTPSYALTRKPRRRDGDAVMAQFEADGGIGGGRAAQRRAGLHRVRHARKAVSARPAMTLVQPPPCSMMTTRP